MATTSPFIYNFTAYETEFFIPFVAHENIRSEIVLYNIGVIDELKLLDIFLLTICVESGWSTWPQSSLWTDASKEGTKGV